MTLMDVIRDPAGLYYLSASAMAFPVARIFRRAGVSPLWAALLAVPEAGLILCMGVLALKKWKRGDAA
jgi:hypothetical protein